MTIRFSTEMKIESKNSNFPIFIYSKIEKKKFNTFVFSFKFRENKLWNSFLWNSIAALWDLLTL